MALIWCDGFESYGIGDESDVSPDGILDAKYDTIEGAHEVESPGLSGHGHALECNSYDIKFKTPVLTANNTLIVGIKILNGSAIHQTPRYIASCPLMVFLDGGTTNIKLLLSGGNTLLVIDGDENVAGFSKDIISRKSTGSFDPVLFQYIEMKVVCHDTNGSVEVRLNGAPLINVTNIQTKFGSNNYCDSFMIGDGSSNPMDYMHMDDLYICDGTGNKNNDFLGPIAIQTLYPDGDDTTEFETTGNGSYGTHYEQVNYGEALWDTDYIEDGTTGNKDIFTFNNATYIDEVYGIIGWTVAENTGNSDTYKMVCESGNTTEKSANITLNSGNVTSKFILENDPNTSNSWTLSSLNAIKFGLEIQ